MPRLFNLKKSEAWELSDRIAYLHSQKNSDRPWGVYQRLISLVIATKALRKNSYASRRTIN
ncbi:hypothetical protein [Nostoc sp.]|uniref:hypothetical protein n=1 Tax=Nostoc sp. TaxID=1180 RepID=UPI002FF77F82